MLLLNFGMSAISDCPFIHLSVHLYNCQQFGDNTEFFSIHFFRGGGMRMRIQYGSLGPLLQDLWSFHPFWSLKTRHHVDKALVVISAWSTKHQHHKLAVDVRPISWLATGFLHSYMAPPASFSTWSAILVTWVLFTCDVVSSPAVSGPLTWSRTP